MILHVSHFVCWSDFISDLLIVSRFESTFQPILNHIAHVVLCDLSTCKTILFVVCVLLYTMESCKWLWTFLCHSLPLKCHPIVFHDVRLWKTAKLGINAVNWYAGEKRSLPLLSSNVKRLKWH